MKIAVIGGTGFLGKAIARICPPEDDLILAASREVDVRDRTSVDSYVQQHRPEWVIMAAALADVDKCELDPDLADAVNHQGAANVAQACKAHGSCLMFISTDYVFGAITKNMPWEVDDPICPVNVYGKSKVAGEEAVRAILPDACIARVSWLFGAEGQSFPTKLMDSVESGTRQISAVSDQRGVPNFARAIAHCLMFLVRNGTAGTVHVTNDGVTSWYEFSRELLALAGLDSVEISPITLEQMNRPARRPLYSAMSDKSLRAHGIAMPHWREALPAFLEDRAALARQRSA